MTASWFPSQYSDGLCAYVSELVLSYVSFLVLKPIQFIISVLSDQQTKSFNACLACAFATNENHD